MATELKARIPDIDKLESRLKDLGAVFDRELKVTDTYFCQPEGFVLKIVKDSKGSRLSRLEAKDGTFIIVEDKLLNNPETVEKELTQEHGIYRILRKKRRFYKYKDYTIDLNLIEELGDFIILVHESPKEEDMEKILDVSEPEYIRVPFSEL